MLHGRRGCVSARWSLSLPWGTVALGGLLLGFLLLPGEIEQKAYLALHGVCAQRPSHSLQLGDATLPIDARMTGIYLGVAATALWLVCARRLRSRARPPLSVCLTLAIFVLLMAADGFNALLFDLGWPVLYLPSNMVRLITGLLAGVALGAGLGYLFAITIWRVVPSGVAIVTRPIELAAPVSLATLLGAVALSGSAVPFAPLAMGLLTIVISVFAALILILLALGSGRAWRFASFAELRGLAVMAYLLAILTVGVLSGLRFIAEQAFGLPQLT